MKRATTPLAITAVALLASVTVAHAQTNDDHATHRSSAPEISQVTSDQATVLRRAEATPPNAMPGAKPGDTRQMAQMMQMQPQGQPGMQRGMMPMPPQGAPGAGSAMPGGTMPMQPQGAPGAMADDTGRMGAMPPQGAPGAGSAMPGGAMPMMQMMQMMQMMMPMMQKMMPMMMPGPPAAPLERVEGSIGFLRAELGVTEAQSQAWDEFAQALRTARGHLTEARQALVTSTAGQSGAPDRLKAYESHLSMRLDSLRSARESFQRLYTLLSPAQKQQADELVVPLLISF